jgi:hypothetical protein
VILLVDAAKKGTFSPLPVEKQRQILIALQSPQKYSSLLEVARACSVSKSTVIAYRKLFVNLGKLSENNAFVVSPRIVRPNVAKRLRERHSAMVAFALEQAGIQKMSANSLQSKFGGDKKRAELALVEADGILRRSQQQVLRKGRADQSYAVRVKNGLLRRGRR